MKQKNNVKGKSYLFKRTDILRRKDMENTIVTVSSIKKEKTIYSNIAFEPDKRTKPAKIKLTNGRYCNAGELQEIK